MCSGAPYPQAFAEMNIALETFIRRNLLPFTFASDINLNKVIHISMRLIEDCQPTYCNVIGGDLLMTLCDVIWEHAVKTLLPD